MKYRKKPVTIDAVQWHGNNFNEIMHNFPEIKCAQTRQDFLLVETLEGVMQANISDYIIRGIAGEFYPCKPKIFEATYELVE